MGEEVEGPLQGREGRTGEVGQVGESGAGERVPEGELEAAEATGGEDVPGIPTPPGARVVHQREIQAMAGGEQVAKLEAEQDKESQSKESEGPAAVHER